MKYYRGRKAVAAERAGVRESSLQLTENIFRTWTAMAETISLKDIVPDAQNNIKAQFILLDKGRVTFEGQQKICLALVADNTASVHFQLWGDECDAFKPSDIIRLTNGIFSNQRNQYVLRAGKKGKIEKVGEFTMVFVETPNMSEIRWVRDPNSSKKYIQEATLSPHSRIFPPMV